MTDRSVVERENRILRKKLERTLRNLRRLEDYREQAQRFHRKLIAEFQANEVRLLESEHRAQQASQAKSEFLATMSHELRTPLNAIIAYSDLLVDEPVLREEPVLVEDIREIHRAGHHLLGLIEPMLELAKVETGHVDLDCESTNVADILRGLEEMFSPLAQRKNTTLVVDRCAPSLTIWVDRLRLRQVLINLVGNAVKYTSSGNIALRIERSGPDRLLFMVEDDGIGISAEDQARIFESFYRGGTSSDHGGVALGLGLGLSVSAALCRRMEGSISVESTLGEGSSFMVELPMVCPCSA